MKIRIKGNTIRLRLSQTEVQLLGREAEVRESTTFGPDQTLNYVLARSATELSVKATFNNDEIRVILPDAMVLPWVEGDQVSLEADQDNQMAGGLSILVEKDFRCLTDRVGEDEEDLFPHPKEGEVNC
ncbi:MAG: hypothetical protein R2824_21685 [Saprospiraceae bacterium]|nr:hypothetical protein [Lewinella sp.]